MGASWLRPRVEKVMGTAVGVTIFDHEADPALIDATFEWFHWVDATFSTHKADSEVSRIGRGEMSLDAASPEVRHVLSRCEELTEATGGRFTIRPSVPGFPAIDPSGFVKGWSVDEASLILRFAGLDCFMINAGGDILCVGSSPEDGGWPIGIRHPLDSGAVAAVVSIGAGAVATSGTYERGDHIWNRADDGCLLSATVVGRDLGTTDALATAVWADPEDLGWMRNFPGYELVLIGEDRKVRWTPGLDEAISLEAGGGSAQFGPRRAETLVALER